jgi:DNA processing protein
MTATTPHPGALTPSTVTDGDLAALVALAGLEGIGPATLHAVLEAGEPARVWAQLVGRGTRAAGLADALPRSFGAIDLDRLVDQARTVDPAVVLAQHRRAGIEVLTRADPKYPERLRDDPAPPAVLFAQGTLDALDLVSVAIVGTRNATRLGCDTAASLARALAERGIAVVSGLALGIDGAAHRGVTEVVRQGSSSGRPIGVVAAGLDVAYPRRHRGLHLEVAELGLLVSEVPLGTPPARWRFPARNRIIAALAHAVVVVESRSAGGSMLTVAEALARDVAVLAVPGHPSVSTAAGPLDLIADGAIPVRDVDDVLVAIGQGGREPVARGSSAAPEVRTSLTEAERRVLEGLMMRPRTLGQLVGPDLGSLEAVASALTSLEHRGLVARSGSWYEATAAGAAHPGTDR